MFSLFLSGLAFSGISSLLCGPLHDSITKILADTATPASLSPNSSPALISPELEAFISKTLEDWGVKGVSIAVVRRNTFNWDVEVHGFGSAGRNGEPMTPDTILGIGSNSKAFAAASVGLLVSNETIPIDWTSKVHEILPNFELEDKVAHRYANFYDLLSHKTGVPRHDFTFLPTVPVDFSLHNLKYFRPSAEFREYWQYNNHMFNLGASTVSHLTGASYREFIKKHIFDEIGFNSTTFDIPLASHTGRLSDGFVRIGAKLNDDGQLIPTIATLPVSGAVDGSGGVFSTARDMALWLQTLIDRGRSPTTGHQVIPLAVLEEMERGHAVRAGASPFEEMGPSVYGLGFMRNSYRGHDFIEHGGAILGHMSQIVRFPNDGLGIAILTNDFPRGMYVHEILKWRIAEELLKMPTTVDWSRRFKAIDHELKLQEWMLERSRIGPPPDAPAPDASPKRLAGVYSHPAYGQLNLTLLHIENTTLAVTLPSWLGGTALWKFTHFSGNHFNLTISFYSEPDDDSQETFEYAKYQLDAEFATWTDDRGSHHVVGLGIWGGLWGAGPGVPDTAGSTVQERAEVWFEKVRYQPQADAPARGGRLFVQNTDFVY